MVEFEVIPDSNIIEFVIDGKITREELKGLTDACESLIDERGKIRMLKQIRSQGSVSIEFKAMWDNMKFGFQNMKHIERVAAVADKAWMGKVTELANPFFSAEMRFFTTDQVDEARAWLREEA